MSRHLDTFGDPIEIDPLEHGTHTWVYYGSAAEPERRTLTTCPHCGEHLAARDLRTAAPHPATKLQEWRRAWPVLRHALDAAIATRRQHEQSFYGYQAETALREFEHLLHTVAELAAGLQAPEDAGSHSSERD